MSEGKARKKRLGGTAKDAFQSEHLRALRGTKDRPQTEKKKKDMQREGGKKKGPRRRHRQNNLAA